ncbi:hypothetical protein [Streptacidiphilus cavernicola]|uniref:Thymidylate kinase-like domain-containing protein n=1 Tax=Streptacidiphilus cavernicola TaxID=3342716 RepID=A0ABV6VYB2_9ACTN
MIALDGMPGAGKTTLMLRLADAIPDQAVVFPEAQPTNGQLSAADSTRYMLDQARDRIREAQRLQQQRPDLAVLSDRCHIGVLAYRFALMESGQGPASAFDQALDIVDEYALNAPTAHSRVLVLTVSPEESVRRRHAHAADERHRLWFDPGFLAAYHYFLTHLATWVPESTFTLHDTTHSTGWAPLLEALPQQVRQKIHAQPARPVRGPTPDSSAAATTRHLLSALAAPPEQEPSTPTLAALRQTATAIRTHLGGDARASVLTSVLHQWRCDLDRLHRDLERTDPKTWQVWRTPGTWLDNQLRLRSLIAHEVGKAYWDGKQEIPYADIDIERYLWGAR